MRYGAAKNERIYFTSADIAKELEIPIHQVGRLEQRFGIQQRKNRAGKRVFREKELNQFRLISQLLGEGKSTDEIRFVLQNQADRSQRESANFLVNPKSPAVEVPSSVSKNLQKEAKQMDSERKERPALSEKSMSLMISELEKVLALLQSAQGY